MLIPKYILIGVIIAFFMEYLIRLSNLSVSNKERVFLILFWPLICSMFFYYFIKELFKL
jgi:hypothetical protein